MKKLEHRIIQNFLCKKILFLSNINSETENFSIFLENFFSVNKQGFSILNKTEILHTLGYFCDGGIKWTECGTHSDNYEPLFNNFNNIFLFNNCYPVFLNNDKNINIFCGIPYNLRAQEYYKYLYEYKEFPKEKIEIFHNYFTEFFNLIKKSKFIKIKNYQYMLSYFQLQKHWTYSGGYEDNDLFYFSYEDEEEHEVENNISCLKKRKNNKILNGLNSYVFQPEYKKFNLFQEEIYDDVKKSSVLFHMKKLFLVKNLEANYLILLIKQNFIFKNKKKIFKSKINCEENLGFDFTFMQQKLSEFLKISGVKNFIQKNFQKISEFSEEKNLVSEISQRKFINHIEFDYNKTNDLIYKGNYVISYIYFRFYR